MVPSTKDDGQFFNFMITLISLIQFMFAFLSIVFSYSIIFKTILKHKRQISTVNQPTENTSDSAANMARDFLRSVRSAMNMFIITIVFISLHTRQL